ncbi:MAG: hypothetical protein RL708_2695 [Bacteroidota bacterium]|jgi:hypothetical protein
MKYNINIPQPCHEDWNKMLPEQKGRHCDACKTVVTDFTIMTDAEIINHLKATASNTCGRFLETQLNRNLIEPTKTYDWFNIPKLSAAASILFSLLQLPALAQNKNEIKTEQTQIQKLDSTKQKLSGDIIIKGTVLNALDDKPMDFIIITAKKKELVIAVTLSNEDGSFTINIPKEYKDSIMNVIVRHVGYYEESKEIKNSFDQTIQLCLTKLPYLTGAVFIRQTKWQRFKRKIRRLF